MRSLLAGTLLAGITLTGSGCTEQPPEPGPAAPNGAEPAEYPGEEAQLMPQQDGTRSADATSEVPGRGLPSPPPADSSVDAAFDPNGPLSGQSPSLEAELTNELVHGDSQFAPPILEEDSPQLELDVPIDFGEAADDFGDLGGRYDEFPAEGIAEDGTE